MQDVDDVDAEAEEVLQELHLLTESEDFNSSDIRSQSKILCHLFNAELSLSYIRCQIGSY